MNLGMHAGSDATTTQYDSFTSWIGQTCVTRNTFAGDATWSAIASPSFLSSATASWINRGPQYQEVMGIAMCPQPGTSPSSSGVKLSDVAAGAGDTYWTQLGQNIAKYIPSSKQHQLVLRLGWEMNGDWYQWGYGSGNNSWNKLPDFIAAWKRIVPLIKAKAPNVKILWCPCTGRNIDPNSSSTSFNSACPADDANGSYVDMVGLDVYDQINTGWLSILNGGGGVIAGGVSALRSLAILRGKPEAYTEWGCHNDPTNGHKDNPQFVLGMYCWMMEAAAAGSSVDHQCYWNTSSGGPNAAIQGVSVPVVTGSISGTTLTLSNIANGVPGVNHHLFTADPAHNMPILADTIITAGSGTSFTVSKSQNVPSQTINIIPVPRAAQMYLTLFGNNPNVTKIAATTSGGMLVPSSPIPKNYATFFDGTNFHVAVHP